MGWDVQKGRVNGQVAANPDGLKCGLRLALPLGSC